MSHVADPTEVVSRILAHPTLDRARRVFGGPVAVVGGIVRDAALGVPHGHDLDLVIEGPADELAARIGRLLGCRVTTHVRFLTAAVELPDGSHLDVVTARRERYPRPGALPVVSAGTLRDDLARRDFSINAMTVLVADDGPSEFVDPHDGLSDLRAGLLRALRAGAFEEDPSRVVRAARYAGRLGIGLDTRTEREARAAASRLDPASARVVVELGRLLDDEGAAAGCALLGDWGVPWIVATDRDALDARFRAIADALARPGAPEVTEWPLRLAAVVGGPDLDGLALPGWARGTAAAAHDGTASAAAIARAGSPSEVDRLLRSIPSATAVAALAEGAEPVAGWWHAGRDVTLAISGTDLVAAGLRPGPVIGRALGAVRAEVLDGGARGREEQLALALRIATEAS